MERRTSVEMIKKKRPVPSLPARLPTRQLQSANVAKLDDERASRPKRPSTAYESRVSNDMTPLIAMSRNRPQSTGRLTTKRILSLEEEEVDEEVLEEDSVDIDEETDANQIEWESMTSDSCDTQSRTSASRSDSDASGFFISQLPKLRYGKRKDSSSRYDTNEQSQDSESSTVYTPSSTVSQSPLLSPIRTSSISSVGTPATGHGDFADQDPQVLPAQQMSPFSSVSTVVGFGDEYFLDSTTTSSVASTSTSSAVQHTVITDTYHSPETPQSIPTTDDIVKRKSDRKGKQRVTQQNNNTADSESLDESRSDLEQLALNIKQLDMLLEQKTKEAKEIVQTMRIPTASESRPSTRRTTVSSRPGSTTTVGITTPGPHFSHRMSMSSMESSIDKTFVTKPKTAPRNGKTVELPKALQTYSKSLVEQQRRRKPANKGQQTHKANDNITKDIIARNAELAAIDPRAILTEEDEKRVKAILDDPIYDADDLLVPLGQGYEPSKEELLRIHYINEKLKEHIPQKDWHSHDIHREALLPIPVEKIDDLLRASVASDGVANGGVSSESAESLIDDSTVHFSWKQLYSSEKQDTQNNRKQRPAGPLKIDYLKQLREERELRERLRDVNLRLRDLLQGKQAVESHEQDSEAEHPK